MIYGFQDFKIFPSDYALKDNILPVIAKSGVIYEVLVPSNFMEERPEFMTVMYTYHHQTERGQSLYGFNCKEDKAMFTDLITVDGFGPSGALKLMSSFTPAKIRIDIADGDANELSKAKGLGKKTADKIILKLQDSYEAFKTPDGNSNFASTAGNNESRDTTLKEVHDIAVKSMVKLGYPSKESKDKIEQAMATATPYEDTEAITRSVLDMASMYVRSALTL